MTGDLDATVASAHLVAAHDKPGHPVIFLHIGEPNTGTNFLQQVMWRNRAELAASEVMLPGPRPLAHWRAAQDLREAEQVPSDPIGTFAGAWNRLARQALRAPHVAVISHDLLAAASVEQAGRAIASLSRAEVHIVLTVRDFATLLPVEYEDSVMHRNARRWEDWLGDVIDHEATSLDRRKWWFWRVHDTLEILRAWSALVRPERVHVITVPPRGSNEVVLWERFAELIGVRPAIVDTARARVDSSPGLAAIEYLRRLNEAVPAQLPFWFYTRNVTDLLAHGVLAARPGWQDARRLELPADRDAWARATAEAVVAQLRDSGYDIVGDLEELLPRPISGTRARPSDITPDQLLEVAVIAARASLADAAKAQGAGAVESEQRVVPLSAMLKDVAIEASTRSPTVHLMRRGYWRTVNTFRRLRSELRSKRADS